MTDEQEIDPGALVSEWYRLKGERDGHVAAADELGAMMDSIAERLGSEFGIVLPRSVRPPEPPQPQPQAPVQAPVSVSTGAFAPSEIDRIRAEAHEGIVESDFTERIAALFERATRGLA